MREMTSNQILSQLSELPVMAVVPTIQATLAEGRDVLLQAEPGAGKTTVVPLTLLDASWLDARRIIMLEPRRIAARSAAERMASLLGERAGQTIGYRMRLDTKVSNQTRVEIVTEGVFTRMVQSDPSLSDVALVIFDEFHERHLDSDLGLTLALMGRSLFRDQDPLRFMLMSATLPSSRLMEMLPEAHLVVSEGRSYPVDIHHVPMSSPHRSEHHLISTIAKQVVVTLKDHPGSSQLVFLPGQSEIRRLTTLLRDQVGGDIRLCPLFGGLSLPEQREAIERSSPDVVKIVLATNIAETSLTIDGVDVVIDSGLCREPGFDPGTAMTRLTTRRISKASATQRAGRAGRLGPGYCYRLWSKTQHDELATDVTPEIHQADMTPLALQLLSFGISDPADVDWLDAPGDGAWRQALSMLARLQAIRSESEPVLTPLGERMCELPVHPRLAHMMLVGEQSGLIKIAARLAAILSDRDPLGRNNPDIHDRLEVLDEQSGDRRHTAWVRRTLDLAEQLERRLMRDAQETLVREDQAVTYLLAAAYPDRVGRRRHRGGWQLSNGRSVKLATSHRAEKYEWIVASELGGRTSGDGSADLVYHCAELDVSMFDAALDWLVREERVVEFDTRSERFVAEQRRCIGALVLQRHSIEDIKSEDRVSALLPIISKSISDEGWRLFRPKGEVLQWLARASMMQQITSDKEWPDFSMAGLVNNLGVWLAPYLTDISSLKALRKLKLLEILRSRLTREQRQLLETSLVARIEVPSGSSYWIDYTVTPPVLAVKLQEMFGATATPAVANGRVPLMLHLLSPGGHPLAVTQDLSGFWREVYPAVRRENRGRYAKHPWPEDPVNATPTRKTNRAQRDG